MIKGRPYTLSELNKVWAWEALQKVLGGQYNNHVLLYLSEMARVMEGETNA